MLGLLTILQTAHAGAAVPDPVQKQRTSQSAVLDMQNMTCELCKFTIKKALLGVEGVEEANVDYGSKTAVVTFNPQKTSAEALIKATTNAGYPATVRQTNK